MKLPKPAQRPGPKKDVATPTLDEVGAIIWRGVELTELIGKGDDAAIQDARMADSAGTCSNCEQQFRKGDWVYIGPDDRPVGINCCSGSAEARAAVPLFGDLGDGAEDIDGRDWVPLSQVLPTGRTKADMCRRCFQIPANNGVCGC